MLHSPSSRREFLKTSALATAAAALSPAPAAAEGQGPIQYAVFTKHFLGMSHEKLADVLASLGVNAIEAPIRPKGHVEPGRVQEDLPKFVEILKARGIEIAVLTSGINALDPAQHTESVLRTAKALGIPRYRMNWYNYDLNRPLWPQLDEIRPRLRDLVAFSREVGILPCYQNHSGSRLVGAPIWDMAMLMRDYKPTELAWCFDIMHATIEGSSAWPIHVNLVRDHMGVAFFKNFQWAGKGHRSAPLGEGVVGRDYVALLKKSAYAGPVSLHVEYLKGGLKDEGYLKQAVDATRRDLDVLKSWWA